MRLPCSLLLSVSFFHFLISSCVWFYFTVVTMRRQKLLRLETQTRKARMAGPEALHMNQQLHGWTSQSLSLYVSVTSPVTVNQLCWMPVNVRINISYGQQHSKEYMATHLGNQCTVFDQLVNCYGHHQLLRQRRTIHIKSASDHTCIYTALYKL